MFGLFPCTYQTISNFVPHILQKGFQSRKSFFFFDPSRCSDLQVLVTRKRHLSQSPIERDGGGRMWRLRRPGIGPPSEPPVGQPPDQECCHLIVDVWWSSVILKYICFSFKWPEHSGVVDRRIILKWIFRI